MYSTYKQQRIVYHFNKGHRPPTIARLLREEGLSASRRGIAKFIEKYLATGSIAMRPMSGRPSKITALVKEIVEQQMSDDDETTAHQLYRLLKARGFTISLATILRCRTSLGWTFRGSSYCQLIRHVNKEKRLEWARQNTNLAFDDVIWSDECTVQLETHRRFCCRKRGQPAKNKPRAKHPTKVHVWAGISQKGPTEICIFEGKMNAPLYTMILDRTLVPFLEKEFPLGHKFMQDNDPKHTSRYGRNFMEEKGVNWWRTPPESPDLNPIENMWHELKEYIRREVKPHTKDQLIDGIEQFWRTVNVDKCKRYIGHLRKVIPKVIEVEGEATGY